MMLKILKSIFLSSILIFISSGYSMNAIAAGESTVFLEHARINPNDMESIKRGAKMYANTCIVCHSMRYVKYDKIAQEAGITLDKMQLNKKNWYFGVTPPDLTLETKIRGVDWVYTYLQSFYLDSARPSGYNNLIVQNTLMPDILRPFRGDQILVKDPKTNIFLPQLNRYDELQLIKTGSMTPEQFDSMVNDIVNFLNYTAEPYRAKQVIIGYWVIVFLIVFFILVFFLKHDYWRDLKRDK